MTKKKGKEYTGNQIFFLIIGAFNVGLILSIMGHGIKILLGELIISIGYVAYIYGLPFAKKQGWI